MFLYGRKMPRQKYIRGLILGQTYKIRSDIEPMPPVILGGQNMKNFPLIFDPSHIWCGLVSKQGYIAEV